jgi:hypothetical protein
MNKLILLLSALTIIFVSCNKKSSYRETAQIIGYDGTMCGCCMGYMIKTSEDKTNTYYLARTLPASAGINPNSTFPINVEIDYEKNDKNCEKVITVTRLNRK